MDKSRALDDAAVVAVYNTHTEAEEAIKELQRSGFDMRQLSILGKAYHSEERPYGFYTTGDRMKTWGGLGAFWGSLWGLLFGAAFFWLPGIGPVAAAGPIIHLLVGALEGAVVVGGISALGAALVGLGVPKDSVIKYETELRADKYLVIAHGTADQLTNARAVMERSKATQTEAFAA
jgi:hypothetical protein